VGLNLNSPDKVVESIQKIFNRSNYFEYVFRNMHSIGFRFESFAILLELEYELDKIKFIYFENISSLKPELWIVVEQNALHEFADQQTPIKTIEIETSSSGQLVHPLLERLIIRCFQSTNDYHISDREELIYPALFSFIEPVIVYSHKKPPINVLLYKNGYNTKDVIITAGFSNPEIGTSPIENHNEKKLSGYGYELIALSEGDDCIVNELINWVKYIINTKKHLFIGNWLEYEEGKIPKTDLSGFLIVNPCTLPEYFPVADGIAYLYIFLGVTESELKYAKNNDVFEVAQKLFQSGYHDFVPVRRKSVI